MRKLEIEIPKYKAKLSKHIETKKTRLIPKKKQRKVNNALIEALSEIAFDEHIITEKELLSIMRLLKK